MRFQPKRWAMLMLAVVGLAGLVGCAADEVVKEAPPLIFPSPPDPPRFVWERVLMSSADVEVDEDQGSMGLKEMLTGEDAVAGRGLGKPYGIVARGGRIYVGDTLKRSVVVFDPARAKYYEVGKEDPGALTKPMGMDMDGQGWLYVMDATSKWVMIYDQDGKYFKAVGGKEMFDRPSSVAVNKEGTRVFVVDTGSSRGKSEFHRIRVFDVKSGKLLFDIGKRGREDGEFNLIRDAKVGPDGMLYVVDGGNFRIQVFDQDGKFVRKFGSVGRRLGQFARPKGLGFDPEGNLYVSDASHGNFQIFNPQGELLMFIGGRGKGNDRASYLLPAMISVDEDGRVYMVDQGYKKVEVYRPASLEEKDGVLGRAFVLREEIASGKRKREVDGAGAGGAAPQEGGVDAGEPPLGAEP